MNIMSHLIENAYIKFHLNLLRTADVVCITRFGLTDRRTGQTDKPNAPDILTPIYPLSNIVCGGIISKGGVAKRYNSEYKRLIIIQIHDMGQPLIY